MSNNKNILKRIIPAIVVVFLIGAVLYGLFWNQEKQKPADIIQGQMQIQQSAIASKIAGRVSEILVTEGEQVKQFQRLIHMDSPEINAKIQQATAGQSMAKNQLVKAKNGARPQEVAQAKAAWQANQAATQLAQSTYQRLNHLYKEGLISRQKRDEAKTKYVTQQLKSTASKEQYHMAKEGARFEDIETAEAQVQQVNGKLQEALIAKKEANLQSPIDGIVDNVFVNPGEVVGQGVPLLTLVDTSNQWVVLNVTENALANFTIGSKFVAEIPALSKDSKKYTQEFTVFSSAALADFATWRATKESDSFDMRTFEIKARPSTANKNVRAGMSVIVTLPSKSDTSHK